MVKSALYILLFLFAYRGQSQDLMSQIFETLQPVDTIPRNLLSTKSIVLLNMDPSDENWSKTTVQIHNYLKKPGIDAVAYYNIQDIYSGTDVTRSYTLDFMKRDIENIILVQLSGNTGKIAVTRADYSHYLELKDLPAWIQEGLLKEITNAIYVKAANSRIERENLLINDIPEIGIPADPVGGNRAAFFSIELNTSKIAIPILKEMDTTTLRGILDKYYPYEYGFVPSDMPEPEMARSGYKYVLHFVKSRGVRIKQFYKYPDSEKVTDYPTVRRRDGNEVVKPIPKTQVVYKFYLKHLRSGRMFLGTEWDADILWSDALINHINSYKAEVGVN